MKSMVLFIWSSKTDQITLDIVYLPCVYKNMHVTDKHKMKDGVYLSQGKKRNGIGAVLSSVIFYFLKSRKDLKELGHTHSCTLKLFGKLLPFWQKKKLTFYSDCTIQRSGGRSFKENSWKTLLWGNLWLTFVSSSSKEENQVTFNQQFSPKVAPGEGFRKDKIMFYSLLM